MKEFNLQWRNVKLHYFLVLFSQPVVGSRFFVCSFGFGWLAGWLLEAKRSLFRWWRVLISGNSRVHLAQSRDEAATGAGIGNSSRHHHGAALYLREAFTAEEGRRSFRLDFAWKNGKYYLITRSPFGPVPSPSLGCHSPIISGCDGIRTETKKGGHERQWLREVVHFVLGSK